MKVYAFIAAEKVAARNINRSCALLSVSRSAYYDWTTRRPSKRSQRDAALRRHIKRIHEESRGTYGAPRVQEQLRKEDVKTARKRVARLMRAEGLEGRQKRRFKRTTIADAEAAGVGADLVGRDFAPGSRSINQAWAADITYIRTWEGWAYLAIVIDLASRRVVGFNIADHMRASLVVDALRMAITHRRPPAGLIFHSDRGSQYTSADFRQVLESHRMRQSLSRPGQCWDNAVPEAFFGTLKTELIHRAAWPARASAREAIFEYIEVFYNRRRLHSALGYRSPADYEACTLQPHPHAAPAA